VEKYDLTPAERRTVERERAKHQAMVDLYKGKGAFVAGDFKAALGYLTQANIFMKSRKIAAVAMGLRVAPRLLLHVQNLRNWVVTART
jgi:hypothetical protein